MNVLIILFSILIGTSQLDASINNTSTFTDEKILGQVGFEKLKVTDIIIGVETYERVQTQDILIDLNVTIDLQKVVRLDDLEATVDYVKLANIARKEAEAGKYLFIDVLGIEILKQVFATYSEVEEASIRIEKPAALPQAKSGGLIEISLTRKQLKDHKILGDIGFDALHVYTVIGDLPVERENQQDLFVDLRATIDLQAIAESNKLEATVNYVEMAKMFEEVANDGKYYMFETLAVVYLKKMYERFPQIEEAYIRIRKPGTLPSYPFKNDAITELRLTR